jgi:multidrug efflux pump subunit AcrB
MVALAAFTNVRELQGSWAVDRLNREPMIEITASPASGVSLAQARATCESQAEKARKELNLPATYRMTWLGEMPGKK